MCGIAGVIYQQQGPIGKTLGDMLDGCQHRGPDSTGFALYEADVQTDLKLRICLDTEGSVDEAAWTERSEAARAIASEHGFQASQWSQDGKFLRAVGPYDGDVRELSYAVEEVSGVEIFSAGRSLEIVKDEGTSLQVDQRFDIGSLSGTHGIGHVRLATESDVHPNTAHPFWAYGFEDVAIVHNGQITNYYKLKRRLQQKGFRFRTMNDSELIAVFIALKLSDGASLSDALAESINELDGTYSFLVSTGEGIGFAKDVLAAKPMVVLEHDGIVAVASEEVALQRLFPDQRIDTYEPFPGASSVWSNQMEKAALAAG
jgi:glutamate synthase domain-containing protein 1